MALKALTEQQKRYEMWVFKRINNKKAFCHCYRGHKCIPSNDESCMSCYQKEFPKT